jgi:hypothetical protein
MLDDQMGCVCPKCKQRQMPLWSKSQDSTELARACQNCGHVETKESGSAPVPVPSEDAQL